MLGWGRRAAFAAALLAGLGLAPWARADISPPPGYDHLLDVKVTFAKLPAGHVFVMWPCPDGPMLSLEPYCVLRAGDTRAPSGTVYALPADRVTIEPYRPKQPDPLARPNQLFIAKPARAKDLDFFDEDPLVVRPGFDPAPRYLYRIVENTGVRSATHTIEIDRVGERGVEGRFVRVSYVCADGSTVEVPWEKSAGELPLPECPAKNERGEIVTTAVESTTPSPSAEAPPSDLPVSPRHAVWLGALLSSLGLIGVGALLRKKPRVGAE